MHYMTVMFAQDDYLSIYANHATAMGLGDQWRPLSWLDELVDANEDDCLHIFSDGQGESYNDVAQSNMAKWGGRQDRIIRHDCDALIYRWGPLGPMSRCQGCADYATIAREAVVKLIEEIEQGW